MGKSRWLALMLAGVTAFSAVGIGGCGKKDNSEASTFSYWISATDGGGTYYDSYEQNPGVEWVNNQYWDVENHTRGEEGNGTNIQFEFLTPVAGAEMDNFNNMLATGEYTDIIELQYAASNLNTMIEEGTLMDITEYVEKYMPDYVKILDEHPAWKSQVTYKDENGDTKYYYIANIKDGPMDSWDCMCYRRDWLVDYAKPTEYIWDWDSAYVQQNGHPAVTPMEKAVTSKNLEGWKKNELYGQKFTFTQGEDPNNDWTDNVIFPSGTAEPITISDWEWMLEAYDKAIEERGWKEDSDSYGISIGYSGFYMLGELASSFGGGTGGISIDKEGTVYNSITTDNMKAYLECMHKWYENGWLDSAFETRASDMFFSINQSGCTQGKVGMWLGVIGSLGNSIRPSCMNETDQKQAFVMGAQLPVNDVYGGAEQKFKDPDALYQAASGPDANSKIGITDKAAEKEEYLPALFTYLNWCYTDEGTMVGTFGLNQEQYESMEFENDLYEEYGFTDGMYHMEDRNGVPTIVVHLTEQSGLDLNAFKPTRMLTRYEISGHGETGYAVDYGYSKTKTQALDNFSKFENTGNILPYLDKLTDEERETDAKISTPMNDWLAAEVPRLIKDGFDDAHWKEFCDKVDSYGFDKVCEIYQGHVDEALGK